MISLRSHAISLAAVFLALAIVSGLIAGWLHFRMDYTGHTEVKNTRRNRVLASTPLLVVAVIMVVLEVGSMAKGFVQRYPQYTTARANLDALGLSDKSCAMANDVLVEADTNAGTLQPVPGQTWGKYGPLGGENPVGFTPNGVSDSLAPPHPVVANPGTVNSDGSPNKPNVGVAFAAGTGGGYGPTGVNGSNVFLPFGLDPARTAVMGSFKENGVAAKATSAWYQLPPRSADRPLVIVAAAGAIWYYDEEHEFHYGQSLKLQWGVHRPDGSYQALAEVRRNRSRREAVEARARARTSAAVEALLRLQPPTARIERDALGLALAGLLDDRRGVRRRVDHRDRQRAGGRPDEAVVVQVVEIHESPLASRGCWVGSE